MSLQNVKWWVIGECPISTNSSVSSLIFCSAHSTFISKHVFVFPVLADIIFARNCNYSVKYLFTSEAWAYLYGQTGLQFDSNYWSKSNFSIFTKFMSPSPLSTSRFSSPQEETLYSYIYFFQFLTLCFHFSFIHN